MQSFNPSTIATAMLSALVSMVLISTAIAFSPTPLNQLVSHNAHSTTLPQSIIGTSSSSISIPTIQHRKVPTSTSLQMLEELQILEELQDLSLTDVSDFYAQSPLQAAVLTCGVKASVADGIAQSRQSSFLGMSDLELRRNVAYIIYGGIFIGALCHYEYDVLFPILFGTEHSLLTSLKEVLFDNFVSAPLAWLPPAYFIKAVVYDYPLQEGLQKYVHDVTKNGLLQKYWTVWVPAQSVSFTVVPDHLRVVFMATVSFFWFIKFSTLASSSDDAVVEK